MIKKLSIKKLFRTCIIYGSHCRTYIHKIHQTHILLCFLTRLPSGRQERDGNAEEGGSYIVAIRIIGMVMKCRENYRMLKSRESTPCKPHL